MTTTNEEALARANDETMQALRNWMNTKSAIKQLEYYYNTQSGWSGQWALRQEIRKAQERHYDNEEALYAATQNLASILNSMSDEEIHQYENRSKNSGQDQNTDTLYDDLMNNLGDQKFLQHAQNESTDDD